LPLHLSDADTHAPPGLLQRWLAPSAPQEGLHTPVANPFSMPVGGGGDPGGGDPPPPPKLIHAVQFDASSWPEQNYPWTEIGPLPGVLAAGPPYWSDPYWDPTTNAFDWNTTFPGTITAIKVSPPEGVSPAYVVGPYIQTSSSYTGQDVAGQGSGGYLYMQIWSQGSYALEVDFAGGSSYKGFLSVNAGPADGAAQAQDVAWTPPALTPNGIAISDPAWDNGFCANCAAMFPWAPRFSSSFDAVIDLTTMWQNNGQQPIDAMLISHGSIGQFQFNVGSSSGNEYLGPQPSPVTPQYPTGDPYDVTQQFGQTLQGKIHSLILFSCHTGQGYAGNDPTHVVQALATDLHAPGGCSVTVSAYTQCVSSEYTLFRASLYVESPGQWVSYTAN
jgi:hypothetical protein